MNEALRVRAHMLTVLRREHPDFYDILREQSIIELLVVARVPQPKLEVAGAHYCECGCGEITNSKQLEAIRLKSGGMTDLEIAVRLKMTAASVKGLRLRQPAKYRLGHRQLPAGAPCLEWACQRCGNKRRMSLDAYKRHHLDTGCALPKFCGRFECNAMGDGHAGRMWRSIMLHLAAKYPDRYDAVKVAEWEQLNSETAA